MVAILMQAVMMSTISKNLCASTYDLKAIIPRVLTVVGRMPPMPYRFLKMVKSYA